MVEAQNGLFIPESLAAERSEGSVVSYESLFDHIGFSLQNISIMEYRGSLGGVLEDLEAELSSNIIDPALRVMHPPRIIRAILNARADRVLSGYDLPLIEHAVAVMGATYTQSPHAWEKLDSFKRHLIQSGNKGLMKRDLMQKRDSLTWEAMDPIHSEGSVKLLQRMYRGCDILFIALANGGIASGMDVFLRYQAVTGSDSHFYPVRYSVTKSRDEFPQTTHEERDYLGGLGESREIVVFDEDVSTGQTIVGARDHFKEFVFPDKEVTTMANCNRSFVPQINPTPGKRWGNN